MLYLAYKDENGQALAGVYNDCELFGLLFNPLREQLLVFSLNSIHGKTYAEKKENLRNKAIDFQLINSEISGGGLSWGEYAAVTNFFETYGRRFGLLREFRENAIC